MLVSHAARSLGRALRHAYYLGARLAVDSTNVSDPGTHPWHRQELHRRHHRRHRYRPHLPVITAASNEEEIEKRLGSVVLSGAALISIDNCTRDLGGEMLCQLAERPLVRIRILGRSEMPECECRTTI